jgi:hypothetical protein
MPDKNWVEPVFAVVSTLVGQLPGIGIVTGLYSASLYQPSIYHGKEPFLLVPLMVGLFATWAVLQWQKAMWVVLLLFLALATIVYWIYDDFSPLSPLHPINWILSYSTFALFVAALTRVILDALNFLRSR